MASATVKARTGGSACAMVYIEEKQTQITSSKRRKALSMEEMQPSTSNTGQSETKRRVPMSYIECVIL